MGNVFEKVSFEQYKKDFDFAGLTDEELKDIYDNIKLPQRATSCSAGYDFYLPLGVYMEMNESMIIPTGVRAKIDSDWFLAIVPRSGLGFKYQVRLANTMGVIDSDYYNASNEGHIMINLVNGNIKTLDLNEGDRFVQGILLPYGITETDNATQDRQGGFGSTGN